MLLPGGESVSRNPVLPRTYSGIKTTKNKSLRSKGNIEMTDNLENKYFFDENYNKYIYQPTFRLANKVAWIDWELYDKYFINGFGRFTDWASRVTGKFDFDGIDQILVDGTGRIANLFGRTFKTVQTGKLQNYVLYVAAGVIILMVIQSF